MAKRVTSKRSQVEQSSPPTPKLQAQMEPSQNEIRLRAYEIYLSRGAGPSDPMRDWLQAERELREAKRVLAAAKAGRIGARQPR